MKTVISLNYQTIIRFAKRIEKENLNNHGSSLSWNSMLADVRVLTSHHGSNVVEVESNWKEKLKIHKR